jgi:ribosome biogenesis GTPase A
MPWEPLNRHVDISSSSRNPMLDQIVQQKPRLILLNKADLADPAQTTLWVNYFREQGISSKTISTNFNFSETSRRAFAICPGNH